MDLNKLLLLVEELGTRIPQRDEINLQVSQANVGWHIEHVLMATVIITEQILRSDPGKYKWHFNKNRLIVFTINRIPRGKGKAPTFVQPKEKTSMARMEKFVEIAKEKINTIKPLPPNSYIEHPYLGMLNYRSCMRFMCIHAKHHLKIINEILGVEK